MQQAPMQAARRQRLLNKLAAPSPTVGITPVPGLVPPALGMAGEAGTASTSVAPPPALAPLHVGAGTYKRLAQMAGVKQAPVAPPTYTGVLPRSLGAVAQQASNQAGQALAGLQQSRFPAPALPAAQMQGVGWPAASTSVINPLTNLAQTNTNQPTGADKWLQGQVRRGSVPLEGYLARQHAGVVGGLSGALATANRNGASVDPQALQRNVPIARSPLKGAAGQYDPLSGGITLSTRDKHPLDTVKHELEHVTSSTRDNGMVPGTTQFKLPGRAASTTVRDYYNNNQSEQRAEFIAPVKEWGRRFGFSPDNPAQARQLLDLHRQYAPRTPSQAPKTMEGVRQQMYRTPGVERELLRTVQAPGAPALQRPPTQPWQANMQGRAPLGTA